MTQHSKPLYPVPRRAATVGMLLFLAALGMLFGSSLVGYFVIRLLSPTSPDARSLHLPQILWLSTAVMIASSWTISRALRAIRAERQSEFRRFLLFSFALAITFVAIQAPAMAQMLREHLRLAESTGMRLYGLLFVLVLLHAMHVIGGVVMLGIIIHGARHGRYDHEHHSAVSNTAMYWHFLDVVWLVMFTSLWIIR